MRKFKVGELITSWPCHTWDQLVDAVARQLAAGPAPMIMAQGQLGGPPLPPTRVLVMNDSGEDVPAGGALKLGDPLILPDDVDTVVNEPPMFKGLATTDDANQTVFIAAEPIPDGAVGFGHVMGMLWAKINVVSESDKYAAPTSDSTVLKSGASGPAKIHWKETGTGEKKAQIILGSVAGSELVLGIYIKTTPAGSVAVTGSTAADFEATITHGYADEAVLVCRMNDTGTAWVLEMVDDEARLVGGVNHSFSELRATVDDPVAMLGYIKSMTFSEEGEEEEDEPVNVSRDVFVPANWDMSSLPNFDASKTQIPFHDEGESGFTLDAKSCDDEEP